jgi:hypothetical protein
MRKRHRQIAGTSVVVDSASKHGARLPLPVKGEHLWVFMALWRVNAPGADLQNFDLENLLTIEGPGCVWCEQSWSPSVQAVACPGDAAVMALIDTGSLPPQ